MTKTSLPSLRPVAALAAFLLLPIQAIAAPVTAQTPHATIVAFAGEVQLQLPGGTRRLDAKMRAMLPEGCMVFTGGTGTVELRFEDAHTVRLGPNSTLRIERLPRPSRLARVILAMLGGRMTTKVDPATHTEFGVRAGGAVAAVKGTAFGVSSLHGGAVVFAVTEGTVALGADPGGDPDAAFASASARGQAVPAGFRVHAMPGRLIPAASRTPPAPNIKVAVITGTIKIITVDGVVTVHPGDVLPEIAPGSEIAVPEGSAVLTTNGVAIKADAGARLTFDVEGGGAGVCVAALPGSTPIQVEVGGTVVTINAGSAATATTDPAGRASVRADQGTVAVTDASGKTRTLAEGQDSSSAPAAKAGDKDKDKDKYKGKGKDKDKPGRGDGRDERDDHLPPQTPGREVSPSAP